MKKRNEPTKRVKRSIRIEQLRQAALDVLLLRARSDLFGEAEAFHAQLGPFSILQTTPFQKRPVLSAKVREVLTEMGHSLEVGYSLDVWDRHGKAMCIEWYVDQSVPVRISSFRRGDWEEDFLKLAARAVAESGV